MQTNERFLEKAEMLKPRLFCSRKEGSTAVLFTQAEGIIRKEEDADFRGRPLGRGDRVTLDFGAHLVGYVTLKLGYTGFHPDAPAWIRLKFAEQPSELFEDAQSYSGMISRSWIQQEQLHIDVLPAEITLPRRYAFRYLQLEVLDVSSRFCLTVEEAVCDAVTSADERRLQPLSAPQRCRELDSVACNTMRSCMQLVFEDGPKRDRRLWLGDLRLQALVNYETYRCNDLVKRCLYLFAGSTLKDGRVGGCLFIEPKVEVDDMVMFDYPLFFIATLRDYYDATGDLETLRELAPTGFRQLELARDCFRDHLVREDDSIGWCFTDWALGLDKQASAQGICLYCLKAAMDIARALGDAALLRSLEEDYEAKKQAAEALWDETLGLYISGKQRQLSWASQVWMTLGGAAHGGSGILREIGNHPEAVAMVTPYMYHNYVDALLVSGDREKARQVLFDYWGGMLDAGADTFWELYNPQNPGESPYGGTIVNSYCHAWSCAPAYFLRKYQLW